MFDGIKIKRQYSKEWYRQNITIMAYVFRELVELHFFVSYI